MTMYVESHVAITAGVVGIVYFYLDKSISARKLMLVQGVSAAAAIMPDLPLIERIISHVIHVIWSGKSLRQALHTVPVGEDLAHWILGWMVLLGVIFWIFRRKAWVRYLFPAVVLGVFTHIFTDSLTHSRGAHFYGHYDLWPHRLALGYWIGICSYYPKSGIWPKMWEWWVGGIFTAIAMWPYARMYLRYRHLLLPRRTKLRLTDAH